MPESGPPPDDRPLIAIVDDEPVITHFVAAVGDRSRRFHTVVGHDGLDAVALRFGSPEPDAMVLNGAMPGMNGLEALDIIRERERSEGRPRLPIALETAWAHHERLASEHGADASIGKPFSQEELLRLVESLLALRARQD